MSQINYDLICEFECSICFNYMQPPMNMCPNGHLYCCSCFNKIDRCPMCRGCKQGARNLRLERLLYFPCKYAESGCIFESLGSAINMHEVECVRKQFSCPIALMYECTWHGSLLQLEQHARDNHRLLDDLTRSYWVPILIPERCWRDIIKFDEALFLLTFCGDVDVLYVGVYVLTSASDKTYNYEFTFNGNDIQTSVAGICSSFNEFAIHKIDMDNRLSFPLNVLNKLKNNGKLFYRINITNKMNLI